MPRFFEYRHSVSFSETNFIGNVYFSHFVHWQGLCREHFLKTRCPQILADLTAGRLRLVTVRVSCDYLAELAAGDDVLMRMSLVDLAQSRVVMGFDYLRESGETVELVARGLQEIACLREQPGGIVPVPVPDDLREALQPFGAG